MNIRIKEIEKIRVFEKIRKVNRVEKLSRNNRVVAITKILIETPNKVIGLNRFSELLNAAKSTISEDIVIVREVLEKLEMGSIETISGAAGGIKFIPSMGKQAKEEFANELCEALLEEGRIVPGNFVHSQFCKNLCINIAVSFTEECKYQITDTYHRNQIRNQNTGLIYFFRYL